MLFYLDKALAISKIWKKFVAKIASSSLWSNGLVLRALDSHSTDFGFKSTTLLKVDSAFPPSEVD